jgi:HlyD family secretion protein
MKRILVLFLAGALAACAKPQSSVLQGYGEADYVYLSSQDAGVLGQLFVKEGDHVAQGAPVFRIDPQRLGYEAQSARATQSAAADAVRQAQANALLTQRNYERGLELARQGFYPRATLDSDRAARDAASATLAQARRQTGAAAAQTGLAQTRVNDTDNIAPAAGSVEQIFHRPGEVVAAGAPIVSLLPPANMKVRFFVPEERLAQFPVGARVLIHCDGCRQEASAHVSFVAAEPQFTPPVIYSLDEREKLVFLVEARLDGVSEVRPGAPVDVRRAP